jgi:hypothetical protein
MPVVFTFSIKDWNRGVNNSKSVLVWSWPLLCYNYKMWFSKSFPSVSFKMILQSINTP